MYCQLSAALLCLLLLTVEGQHTPFKVGVGTQMEGEKTRVCTDDEDAFIRETIHKYIIGLGRLFFRDETFELPHGLQDIDSSHFSEEAFANFNAYEVEKYSGAGVGQEVQVTVTDPPSASPAPSAVPSQTPLEVFIHIEESHDPVDPVGSTAPAPTPTPTSTSGDVLMTAKVQDAIVAEGLGTSPNVASVAEDPVSVQNDNGLSNGIPLPCCGWNGNGCSSPESKWCHAEEGRCTGVCTGTWYTGNSQNLSATTSTPTSPPSIYPTVLPTASPITRYPSAPPTALSSHISSLPPSVSPSSGPPSNAPSLNPSVCEEDCMMLDFENYPNGTKINPGAFVGSQLVDFGVKFYVNALNAFGTKLGASDARIFDTTDPSSTNAQLGSPNAKCAGGGPGVGEGGGPNTKGENCKPLGNVLIIQDIRTKDPDDNYYGGEFTFQFAEPMEFKSIGFLDLSHSIASTITVQLSNGNRHVITVPALGVNSFQTVSIPYSQVVTLRIYMPQQGAITHLSYCKPGCASTVTSGGRRQLSPDVAEWKRRGLRGKRSPASFLDNTSTVTDDIPPPHWDSSDGRELLALKPAQSTTGGYLFYYGGQGEFTCRYCGPEKTDRRQLFFTRKFLVSSLETIMSFGLTADMAWNYKDFLRAQNKSFGCLGNGDGIRVVLELTAVRPINDSSASAGPVSTSAISAEPTSAAPTSEAPTSAAMTSAAPVSN